MSAIDTKIGARKQADDVGHSPYPSLPRSDVWGAIKYLWDGGAVSSQVGAYSVVAADRNATIALGGSAFYSLTVPAASGFDPGFSFRVVNTDTGRGKRLAIDGLSATILWPGQSVLVREVNDAWAVDPPYQRWKLPGGGLTVYVNPSLGTDPAWDGAKINWTTDGLGTGAGAFASIDGALGAIHTAFDFSGAIAAPSTITIELAAGATDTTPVHFSPHGDPPGSFGNAGITINLNGGTLRPTGASQSALQLYRGALLRVRNGTLAALHGDALGAFEGALVLVLDAVTFGATPEGSHMSVQTGGTIALENSYTVSGSALFHIANLGGTVFQESGITITVSANITFGQAVVGNYPGRTDMAGTWSLGAFTVTGSKHQVQGGHLLLGAANIPGTVAGTALNGGIVDGAIGADGIQTSAALVIVDGTNVGSFIVRSSDNGGAQIVSTAGNLAAHQYYKDSTPTKAVASGMGVPGASITDDWIVATNDGATWAERLRVRNADGGMSLPSGLLEFGHATNTTISRVSAGVIAIEGSNVLMASNIGVSVQAYDADLTTWAGLTPSANAQSLVTAANYAAMRALLDLEAGTDFYSITAADAAFQPKDADLTTWASLTPSANFQTMAPHTFAEMRTDLGLVIGTNVQAYDADLTTLGAGGSGARSFLGLDTMATQAASAVAITGGTISGITAYGFSVYKAADTGTITAGVATKIAFDTENHDAGGAYDAVTNKRYNAPVAGVYQFNAHVAIKNLTSMPNYADIWFYKNGSAVASSFVRTYTLTVDGVSIKTSSVLSLAANDTVEVYVTYNTVDAAAYGTLSEFSGGRLF